MTTKKREGVSAPSSPKAPPASRRRTPRGKEKPPVPGGSIGVEQGAEPGTSIVVSEVREERTALDEKVEAVAEAVNGTHIRGAMFRAIARTTAAKHIGFLDRVIAGQELDVYSTMVGPVMGPARLATRIRAYEALTKGGVIDDDGAGAGMRARRAVLMVPIEEVEG